MQQFINKIFLAFLIISGQCTIVNGQMTSAIPYQGVARNAAGNIVANQSISLRFSILEGSASTGTLVYEETHSVTTSSLGLFDVKITGGATGPGVFNPLDWKTLASVGAFLKVELDITGGSNYVDMGTTQLLSVPFALYAEKAKGSVVYAGTWNALTNDPPLAVGVGTQGDYYEVSVAGVKDINGYPVKWDVGDWAVYNGSKWQKVDNTESPVGSADVSFIPNGDITATNVQDAIVEVRDNTDTKLSGKQNALGFVPVPNTRKINSHALSSDVTVTKSDVGLGNVVNLDATIPSNISQDATHRFVTDTEKSTWNGKQNSLGFTPVPDTRTVNGHQLSSNVTVTKSDVGLGNVVNVDATAPSNITQDATHRFVTDTEKSTWNGKLNLTGGTMTGDLILNAAPTTALGAATKQYVDAADALKLNLAGGTLTGALVLNADPSTALGAATKKYVDDADALKLNLAGGTMTGNLVLNADPSTALGAATKKYVDDANALLGSSYIHKTDDGVSIYLPAGSTRKRFGIGDTAPDAPLGIVAEGSVQRVLTLKPNTLPTGSTYNFSLTAAGSNGFNLEEASSSGGAVSRLFIQEVTGHMSLNRIDDRYLLGLNEYSPNGRASIGIRNTAVTSRNSGWSLGHFENGDIPDQDGIFAVSEEPVVQPGVASQRLTIRPGGNIGINETIPDTKLHVTRPIDDPLSALSLSQGTGLVTIGPITNNIVADYRGIQARTGQYTGTVLNLSISELNIQRLGGDILIHGDDNIAVVSKGIITSQGNLGLGTITPVEKIDINGAIKIGTSTNSNEGTIRWTGSDFEGRKSNAWVSLTAGSGPWSTSSGNTIYYTTGTTPRVGIGINTASSTLHVYDTENASSSNSAAFIHSEATTSSISSASTRIGLEIKNSLQWSANADAKNVGLYVSSIAGQSSKEANIAAVLNGNLVVGDLTSSNVVGSNGKNVLAIQTGTAPLSPPGTGTGGIQIYSNDLSVGAGSPPASVVHVMNGDGSVVKLYKTDALTAPDNSTISSTTYGTSEEAVINNLRIRINELETRLKELGLLK